MTESNKISPLFTQEIVKSSLVDSFTKLSPKTQIKNPVMFVVALGSFITTIIVIVDLIAGKYSSFNFQITLWLWFTLIFANFAEAIAERRGKAQADSLRKSKIDTKARKIVEDKEKIISAAELRIGDLVVCESGDIIPGDGEVIEGIATVDEAAITGESAPVIRESGGDRSAVTGGTKVISDKIIIRITSDPGNSFLDRMISMVEGAKRKRTPNEIALTILLVCLTAIFILAVFTLYPFVSYSESAAGTTGNLPSVFVLVALLVCLIPTTIGALLSAIGISGMDRLIRKNVIAMSGKSVEAAGDIDVLLLDKTGTITLGNRMATEFIPAPGIEIEQLADAAQLASLADETPEGRSIVILAKEKFGIRGRNILEIGAKFIPFSAQTQMSGVDLPSEDGKSNRIIRKGSLEAIRKYFIDKDISNSSNIDLNFTQMVGVDIALEGGTPLLVVENEKILGVIQLKDIVKGGIRERFGKMRKMGIKTIMITGDNPLTAAAIAAEAGVDDFMAQARPEDKLRRICEEQNQGHLVAMMGDGTNDAPALAQADVGVAMNTGTQAAREAGNMVDLDSNPTKLLDIVEVGKQLLITRGALTTFSIANDVSKYFAILPAMFGSLYAVGETFGPLTTLNIMKLTSPSSSILSAVIFNALIIIALIPLALKGVTYKPMPAVKILKNNLLTYGLGGIIIPFIAIKIIDLIIVAMGLI